MKPDWGKLNLRNFREGAGNVIRGAGLRPSAKAVDMPPDATAGAPALYVALRIAEKEEDRKVSLREFLSWSLPFTLISSFVCYVLAMLIWVLPHSN